MNTRMPAIAAPTPIPAFTPVLKPPLVSAWELFCSIVLGGVLVDDGVEEVDDSVFVGSLVVWGKGFDVDTVLLVVPGVLVWSG